jgi:SAM-dependent methyltransferase
MHDTAYLIGRAFFESYVRTGDLILEIGSMNVNGSLRDFCPPGARYVGVDLGRGAGVDVVVGQISRLPFAGATFDSVVSSSCFEHDGMFWVTFLEICRVLKDGGYLYINAPSRGSYHRYPIDAWRFFPDAAVALNDWARNNGHDLNLLESFIAETMREPWADCVMIFGKRAYPPPVLVAERYRRIVNVRAWPDLARLGRAAETWPG